MRRSPKWMCVAVAMVWGAISPSLSALAEEATGVVFEDKNGNGRLDSGEQGIKGVAVSNGREVTATDGEGRYSLSVDDDTAIFVIKPSGWQTRLHEDTNLPQFFYIHKPGGSPEGKYAGSPPTGPLPDSIDFALTRQSEPKKFRMLCLGDTQPRDQREVDFISHDTVEELAGFEATLGVTLGDIVFNDLDMLEQIAQSIGLIGAPWYHVIGNHDLNFDAAERWGADETFERVMGPSYIAFNYADVHFIILNDVFWDPEEEDYHGELGPRQLEFIKNDLSFVPKDRLIVLMMHIPLAGRGDGNLGVKDQRELFALLADYPHTFSISAHWHTQENFFLGPEHGWQGEGRHHHLVQATACGSWWSGRYDSVGLPDSTMRDGAPKGYSIIEFDGHDYTVEFKPTRRPAGYQMNVFAPEVVASSDSSGTEVIVNVFAGSERSTVEMRLGESGPWVTMENYRGIDPFFSRLRDRQDDLVAEIARAKGIEDLNPRTNRKILSELLDLYGRGVPAKSETGHLWRAYLPDNPTPGYRLIHVRTTDQFGHAYEAKRVIRIE